MGLLTTKIKSILDYYIDSSFHVSLCTICYVLLIYNQVYFSIEITDYIFYDLLFIFGTTYFAYNFIKFYEILVSKSKPIYILTWVFFILAIICLLFSVFIFFLFPLTKQIISVFIAFLTISYTIPFYKKYTLRSNPLIKILTISISWVFIIVVLPFIEILDICFLTYYSVVIFLMVTVQMVPFEIRDAKLDAYHTKNSVNVYGLKLVKKIGYILLFSILVFQIIFSIINDNFKIQASSLIILVIMALLIRKSTSNQFKYYSSFLVESVPIYWLIIDLLL